MSDSDFKSLFQVWKAYQQEARAYRIKEYGHDPLDKNCGGNMMAETIQDVHKCQRCGQNHKGVRFSRLTNPIDEFRYWAMCPVVHQPILMAFVADVVKDKNGGKT